MSDLKSVVATRLFGGKIKFRSDERSEDEVPEPVVAPVAPVEEAPVPEAPAEAPAEEAPAPEAPAEEEAPVEQEVI